MAGKPLALRFTSSPVGDFPAAGCSAQGKQNPIVSTPSLLHEVIIIPDIRSFISSNCTGFDRTDELQRKQHTKRDTAPKMVQYERPDVPPMKDLTTENITDNVETINSKCPDPRLKFLLERLVNHLHDFARETRLSIPEWEATIKFLVDVGQISTDVRHEFVLLSDVLGLSLLVDSIDHPKVPNATEGTVLGPFHSLDAHNVEHGHQISNDADGEPMIALCTVKDTQGRPIPNVAVDVWETDSKGFYDVQYRDRGDKPDGRAIVESDENGVIFFKAIVPVPYPIPNDGPVGKLLEKLKRHCYRPSHMHFMFKKPGFDRLIT